MKEYKKISILDAFSNFTISYRKYQSNGESFRQDQKAIYSDYTKIYNDLYRGINKVYGK